MYDKLGLRLRFALFFAALAVGGVVALVGGLWLGASRAGGPIDGYVIAGLVGSLGIIGLSAWIGLLFDENVARPILGLSADLSTRAAADIGGKDIDEMPARYLGALAPAANAINTSLAQARTAQSRAIASETHQLQREKRLFEALVRDLTEGVIITKSDQRVMLFNRSAQNLLDGLGLDRRLPTLLRPGPLNQALARLAQRLPQEKGRSESFMTTSIDGSRYLLGQISRIESPQGFVITLRDTTQKLAAYAERDDLFNSLMDGIRQPATIIGTTLDLLQNAPDLDADRRAQLIQAQSDQLGRMTACPARMRSAGRNADARALAHGAPARIRCHSSRPGPQRPGRDLHQFAGLAAMRSLCDRRLAGQPDDQPGPGWHPADHLAQVRIEYDRSLDDPRLGRPPGSGRHLAGMARPAAVAWLWPPDGARCVDCASHGCLDIRVIPDPAAAGHHCPELAGPCALVGFL